MYGQVKVEFEELFRGWTAIHINLENGERFSFYNPQAFEEPSDESPAFHFGEGCKAQLTDVLVEKGRDYIIIEVFFKLFKKKTVE